MTRSHCYSEETDYNYQEVQLGDAAHIRVYMKILSGLIEADKPSRNEGRLIQNEPDIAKTVPCSII